MNGRYLPPAIAIIGVIVGAAIVMAAMPGADTGSDTGSDTISVTGTGEIEADPDRAEIVLGIEITRDTAEQARADNAERAQNVVDALLDLGLNESQIETEQFSVRPERSFNRTTGETQVTGYTATNTLRITTNDTDQAADIIDTGVSSGANTVQRVTFTLRDTTRDQLRERAIDRAVTDADTEASATLTALGLNLGDPKQVSVGSVGFQPFQPRFDLEEAAPMPTATPSTPIRPGRVTVTATVQVTYRFG